jgi:hypothetical protein
VHVHSYHHKRATYERATYHHIRTKGNRKTGMIGNAVRDKSNYSNLPYNGNRKK